MSHREASRWCGANKAGKREEMRKQIRSKFHLGPEVAEIPHCGVVGATRAAVTARGERRERDRVEPPDGVESLRTRLRGSSPTILPDIAISGCPVRWTAEVDRLERFRSFLGTLLTRGPG